MTRRSRRELERALDELDHRPPDDPPHWWMAYVPQRYWDDKVEALRQLRARVEEAAEHAGGSA